jgi:predicted nucleic acid-binding protein
VITAVDSTILLDIVSADRRFGNASREALRSARRDGRLVACDAVWAEFGASYSSTTEAEVALLRFGLDYDATEPATALLAGSAWRAYRSAGGPRSRIMADFLIAAHAQLQADRLLTRDRGFYRRYFANLDILDPSGGGG